MRIGIFDSGVGGLTVYSVLKKRYSHCDFVYFADTAHLPYGGKSRQTIISYSRRITGFLLENKCDLIVCACNTASSVALPSVRKMSPVPVYGVIEAAAYEVRGLKRVAVIGTKLTIKSGAYERAIRRINPAAKIYAKATPLLVPLVEEGWAGTDVCRRTLEIYLAHLKKMKPQALILACTHYPVLKKQIAEFLGGTVRLVDSGSLVNVLDKHIKPERGVASSSFYVSDDAAHFKKIAAQVMKVKVGRVKLCTEFL